jgi:hypothetical protein
LTDLGAGSGGFGRVALTIRPPRTTWFQPDPRLSCSAVGCGVTTLFAAGWTAAPLVRVRCLGTCFASAVCLFALAAAPVVGRVVAPAAATALSAQYSGSQSPHHCNKLFLPANRRRAAQGRPGIKGDISSQNRAAVEWCGAMRSLVLAVVWCASQGVSSGVRFLGGRSRTVVGRSTHCSRGVILFAAASLVLQWVRGSSSSGVRSPCCRRNAEAGGISLC